MKDDQFVGRQWEHCVRFTLVVREFHLKTIRRQFFDDGAYLTADESVFGPIMGEGDNIENFDRTVHH